MCCDPLWTSRLLEKQALMFANSQRTFFEYLLASERPYCYHHYNHDVCDHCCNDDCGCSCGFYCQDDCC